MKTKTLSKTTQKLQIGEYASLEIYEKIFPNTWIAVLNPHFGTKNNFLGGEFIGKSKTRQGLTPLIQKIKTDYKVLKVFYTGAYSQANEEFLL